MDYSRTDCIKSYFELVVLLNKGNKIINEQTEAKFFVVDNSLYLGLDLNQKLCLSVKDRSWFPGNFTSHAELERFVSNAMNAVDPTYLDFNFFIKEKLFKLSD